MEKILVTGATVFLGKYIVKQLLSDGYEVKALGRNEKAAKKMEQEEKGQKTWKRIQPK